MGGLRDLGDYFDAGLPVAKSAPNPYTTAAWPTPVITQAPGNPRKTLETRYKNRARPALRGPFLGAPASPKSRRRLPGESKSRPQNTDVLKPKLRLHIQVAAISSTKLRPITKY
jgi:hypothetical protein